MDQLVNRLIKTLKDHQLTLAFAESMTCGMAAAKLGNAIGTSDVFKGGIVCYTAEVKQHLLGISEKTICQYTCESPQVTSLLSKNLQKLIKADIYASITGLASQGGSETDEKPVGTVFFSIRTKKKEYAFEKRFMGSPKEIRTKACKELYRLILKAVRDEVS